jgi:hypothetical protein
VLSRLSPHLPQMHFGPNVAAWMGKMVGKAAEGSWEIATSAAGSVLGKALARYYGMP